VAFSVSGAAEEIHLNPLVLQLVNGTSFFVGLTLTAAACGSRVWCVQPRMSHLLAAVSIVGVGITLMSGTALPIAMYAIWIIGFGALLLLLGRPGSSGRQGRTRSAAIAGFLVLCAGMGLWELQYHRSPRIELARDQTVYVIGDSISAGMRPEQRTWPLVLADLTGLNIVNLAQAGAMTANALKQADGVEEPDALIILEIGGNDLLGGTDSQAFRCSLDQLLAKLCVDNHRLVMFELPLPPLRNPYGRAQRELAHRYGVTLIPKRYMTRIIGMPDGTLDGLHLSQAGHGEMAASVRRLLHIK
jgi:acyl-CoA thioesterase-1